MQEILTKAEVAEMLKMSPKTISYMVHTQQIPFLRLGKRRVRFSRVSLEQWIKDRESVEVKYNSN